MMSRMNGSQAIQAALDAAAQRMDELMIVRLAPDGDAPCTLSGRRLTLPLNDAVQLPFCTGCSAAGLKVVLDLTGLRDGTHRLEQAWSALERWPQGLILRARDRYCPSLQGVHVLRPNNSRECAASVRHALNAGENCLILEDPLKAFELCEVPQEELLPGTPMPDMPPQEPVGESVPAIEHDEPANIIELADDATQTSIPVPAGACCRLRPYDPSELQRTAKLLNITLEALAERCCRGLTDGVTVTLELDAQLGEVAIISPANGQAALWIGRDRAALCWQGGLTHEAAKIMLHGVISALELPARLIMA